MQILLSVVCWLYHWRLCQTLLWVSIFSYWCLDYLKYKNMWSANLNNLTSSFQICTPLIYVSCVLSLLKLSDPYGINESVYSSASKFTGNASTAVHSIGCWLWVWHIVPCLCSFCTQFDWGVYNERGFCFIKWYLCMYQNNHMGLFFIAFANTMRNVYLFVLVEQSFRP